MYSSHRDAALLARLKATYPRLLILFIPASCTSELQALDVGFNGPWKGWTTHFANKWLAGDIRRQLDAYPDPTHIRLGMKKSDLVEHFCGWIADATAVMKTKPELIRRLWEKTGVLVAWAFGSAERNELLRAANELHAAGELWKPILDKVAKSGTVPRTRMVCHGLLHDIGTSAASSLGGCGAEEKEQEVHQDGEDDDDGELEKPEDFDVFGEQQNSIEDTPRTPKEQEDYKSLADLSAAQDACTGVAAR